MSALQTLADVGIVLKRPSRPGQHRAPCPWCYHGPQDDALSVRVEPDGAATWFCHRCNAKGGLGGPERRDRPARAAPRRTERAPEPEKYETLAPWAERIWQQCRPITPTSPAGRYLEGRGCALPPWPEDSDLRWHAELRHPSGFVGPALVALITDAETCEPLSLHRTWLKRDGSGKAAELELGEGGKPRLLLAKHRSDGCVRLWPDEEVTLGLTVGEGLESSLAAARAGLAPVWACLNARNLAQFPVLRIEGLTILVDHDKPNPKTGLRAGQEAALALIERYVAAGFDPERDIRVIMPPTEGEDANDLARRMLG